MGKKQPEIAKKHLEWDKKKENKTVFTVLAPARIKSYINQIGEILNKDTLLWLTGMTLSIITMIELYINSHVHWKTEHF